MKRFVGLFIAAACSFVGMARAEDTYQMYPVEETIQHSADRVQWVMDVVDSNGVQGTVSVNAVTGEYEATWGGTPESGNVGSGTAETETEGMTAEGIHPVVVVVAACLVLQARAQALIAQATQACYQQGGYPSGGSVGRCGTSTMPTCNVRNNYTIQIQ